MNDLYDEQTVAVMRRILQPNSNCVDVGCHKGDILRSIIEIAPAGTHYAFEPIPGMCQDLKIAFPSVHIFNLALSDAIGETTFQHVISNPAYSGLKRRQYEREEEVIEQIRITTERLDDILPPDLPIDFIKIDVEGAELQVLKGSVRTLARHQPFVIFEHGLGAANFYGTRPEDIHDLLAETAGLRIFLMESWLQEAAPLSRDEFRSQFQTGTNYYFLACRG